MAGRPAGHDHDGELVPTGISSIRNGRDHGLEDGPERWPAVRPVERLCPVCPDSGFGRGCAFVFGSVFSGALPNSIHNSNPSIECLVKL